MQEITPELRDQIERAMADPTRLLPSEVEHLQKLGFKKKLKLCESCGKFLANWPAKICLKCEMNQDD